MFLTAVVLSIAVAIGFSQPLNEAQSKDRVRDLVDAAVAYARSQVKIDSFPLADSLNLHFYGFRMNKTNANLTGLSHVIFNHEETDPIALSAKLRATIPEVTYEFHYQLGGEFFGRSVSGEGKFKAVGTNVSYDVNNITFGPSWIGTGLDIPILDGFFSFDDLTIEMDAVEIAGKRVTDLGKYIETLAKYAYHVFGDVLSKELSSYIRIALKWSLSGLTMEEATQWLRNHTD